jgi:nitrite reductase (NADH) large subunit
MRDAEKLLARQVGSRSTVVVGGGLLGLEVARAMRRFGTRVHVVEHEARLMLHQLDEEAALLLRERVEELGIPVHLGESVQQIVGMYRPELVRLRSGREIDCDTVVLATGIVPNVELARDARLAVGRGITVDDRMQTSDPAIQAIGECAEHRGRIYGLVGPGLEQAGVAANHLAGRPSDFRGSIVASSLKVVGCAVFSMGDSVDSVHDFNAHVFRSAGTYRRINVHRGRIIGAIGFGDWDTARLRTAGLEQTRVWPWQLWRFRRQGELWNTAGAGSVAAWPATATVCSCRGVTREALEGAIAAGASTVESLSAATGAATVCGSCKPLLGALLGGASRQPLPRVLLTASFIGLALALAAYFLSLPYASEMQPGWRWDQLWTDGNVKQVSGFSLLGLGLLLSLISLRKRIRSFRFARYSVWQTVHVVGGVAAVAALLAHTGFRFGDNLNAWLMLSFTTLIAAGGLAGTATAFLQRADQSATQQIKSVSLWVHILLLWPLPALLGFHVLKAYWF